MLAEYGGILNGNETEGKASSWLTHLAVARMAYERGLYSAAVRNFYSALSAADSLGLPDEKISAGLLGLAKCYCALGNFDEAENLYKRVLEIDQETLSSQCATVAMDLNELAALYIKSDRLSEAEQLLKQAVAILKTPGSDAIQLALAQKNLGLLYTQSDKLDDAESVLNQAFTICDTSHGRQTKVFGEILLAQALLLAKKGSYTEAEGMVERAISSFELATGGSHPELAEFLDAAAELFRQENLPDKVDGMTSRAKSIRKHLQQVDR